MVLVTHRLKLVRKIQESFEFFTFIFENITTLIPINFIFDYLSFIFLIIAKKNAQLHKDNDLLRPNGLISLSR